MHRVSIYITIIFLILAIAGCSELFVQPHSSTEPVDIFELVWSGFDRYYPFFIDKEIDWDSLYSVFRVKIDNGMSEQELYRVLSDMTKELRDGHVNIYTPFGTSAYTGWYDKYPQNFYFNFIRYRYLLFNHTVTGGGNIHYGRLGSMGYVYIESFSGAGKWAESIDEVIEEFKDLDGIIIDVRNNGGGSSADANTIAGRFTDRNRVYSYIQYRNGPRHTDFTDLRKRTISPGGVRQYLKPIVLLTNRSTFSAAEDFTLAMRELPHVTHFGDTTGGGFGNPIFRELPNGWGYRLPVWRQFPVDLKQLEGIGIAPDRHINISSVDAQRQVDTIIERALEYLAGIEK
jgi:hypothetical protein